MTTELAKRRYVSQPFDDYAAIDAINASSIKAGMLSMLHMHHYMTQGGKEESPAMRMGRFVHGMVLEPDVFAKKLCLWEGATRRGKKWDLWCAENDPEYAVTPKQLADLVHITAMVHSNRDAHALIEATEHEVGFVWSNERYGRGKARMDGQSASGGILEYKTTQGIGMRQFTINAYRMGYHVQLGWYAHGVEQVTGEIPQVHVIVQEQAAPYDCYVLRVPHQIIEVGMEEAIEIARRYSVHNHVGSFPGVAGGEIMEYELPPWSIGGDNAEVSMEGIE